MKQGEASYSSPQGSNVEIEIDIELLARALVSNKDFIRRVTTEVRRELLAVARNYGNLWGKWGSGR